MLYFVIFVVFLIILFIFWPSAIFCYIFIYIAIEALWFSVFIKIVFSLPNIHRYAFSSICSYSIVCLLSVDLYLCFTKMITIFHSLSVFSTAIGKYSSIVFIIFIWIFFSIEILYISCLFQPL